MIKVVKVIIDLEDMLKNEHIAWKIERGIEGAFFLVKIVAIEVSDGTTDTES